MNARFELSTRPENKLGTDEEWDFTEGALRAALERRGLEYDLNEGDGAFYGPKIDLHMTDVARPLVADGDDPARLRRCRSASGSPTWAPTTPSTRRTSSTARCSARSSASSASSSSTTAATSRSGSRRCRCGSSRSARRTARRREALAARLKEAGARVEVDERDETVGKRIRDAELEKIPRVVVYGDRESADALAVRERGGGQSTKSLDELIAELGTL